MSITVITPTGDRPEAMALCERYLERQTMLPTQWIVVDDGREPLKNIPKNCMYIQKGHRKRHTLCSNVLTAMNYIENNYLIFMEDDDWYHPKYIEVMYHYLQTAELVGPKHNVYYNLEVNKYLVCPNFNHASLCCTGLHSRAFQTLVSEAESLARINKPFLDLHLWRHYPGSRLAFEYPIDLCIGIKGMPGRRGVTKGWDTNNPKYNADPDREILRWYIGEDAENYETWNWI